ncbi:MAG: peptidoglycan editing factor PgeF [Candidatus Omnitrophota bacterium]
MRRLILAAVGAFCLFIGLLGLILPFLPGWLFIFVGLSLIAPKFAEKVKGRVYRKLFKKDIVYAGEWRKTGVHAGFTTRHFPFVVSKTDDLLDPANQERFRKLFVNNPVMAENGVGPVSKFAFLSQVHADGIAVLVDKSAYAEDRFYHFPGADALLTNVPGLALLVLTADCLPVFLRAGSWIGLVHAGWRGTQKEISKKAFRLLVERSGAKPADVHIAFGPRIGKDRYEVGEEFSGHFRSVRRRGGKLTFDLGAENKLQLLAAGASSANIVDHEICTVDENENFYSFRREKDAAGRMISFIIKT